MPNIFQGFIFRLEFFFFYSDFNMVSLSHTISNYNLFLVRVSCNHIVYLGKFLFNNFYNTKKGMANRLYAQKYSYRILSQNLIKDWFVLTCIVKENNNK